VLASGTESQGQTESVCRKKKTGEGEKKNVYDCRSIVDATVVHSTLAETPPSQTSK